MTFYVASSEERRVQNNTSFPSVWQTCLTHYVCPFSCCVQDMNTSQDSIASANGKGANVASKPGALGGQVTSMAGKKRKQRPNGSTSEKSLDDDGGDPGQPMLQKMFNEKMMIGKSLKPDFAF